MAITWMQLRTLGSEIKVRQDAVRNLNEAVANVVAETGHRNQGLTSSAAFSLQFSTADIDRMRADLIQQVEEFKSQSTEDIIAELIR